jgi:hypothetical protein
METSCVSFKIKTEFLNTFPMEVVLQVWFMEWQMQNPMPVSKGMYQIG